MPKVRYSGKKAIIENPLIYITNSEKRDALSTNSFLSWLTVGQHREWPKADQTFRAIENAPLA